MQNIRKESKEKYKITYNKDDCIKDYKKELKQQLNPYIMWIKEKESLRVREKSSVLADKIVLFYNRDGMLSDYANEDFLDFFRSKPNYSFAYGDEDFLQNNKRTNPWFKPEFSPDTIKSLNYFGNCFAVKRDALLEFLNETFSLDKSFDFIRRNEILKEDNGLVTRISFSEKDYDPYWTMVKWFALKYQGGHVNRILYHGSKEENISLNIVHNLYDYSESCLISIIIPSKDNVDMLFDCIDSIKYYSSGNYEIIVVDNGSCLENKTILEEMSVKMNFTYIYEKMEFNFSKMCNIGAKISNGDCLIFLNDDITVATKNWDIIMAAQAMQPKTAAVGAKLYYPDSTIIQHVGVTNMAIGPAHKLSGLDDDASISIYHGRNLADYNVSAVTGAALCIESSKFVKIGGFREKLQIAYNDVALCFRALELGYYNLVRNDVVLYHHESVSRGTDEDGEKKKRLLKEREYLYTIHWKFQEYDPFYSPNLVQYRFDVDYNINYLYPFEREDCISEVEQIKFPKDNSFSLERKLLKKGPVCQLNIDSVNGFANNLVKIDGWAGLTDVDECLYDRYLILWTEDGITLKISVFNKLRDDAAAVMPMQKYNRLLGFSCHIEIKKLSLRKYNYGIMFVNRINGKTIVYYEKNKDNYIDIEGILRKD